MGCGGHPTPTPLPKKGICCHHFGQHHDILNIIQGDSFGTRPKKMRISQRLFIRFWINFCNIFTYKYIYNFINIKYIYKILNWIMNNLWDIRIFLGLVPKPCTFYNTTSKYINPNTWIVWGRTVLQIGRSLVRLQMVPLEFFIDIILPIALWPWGRLVYD
jgi:hypothetical protein